ncbi:unnamed protein product [Trifolium pratense]|uniref:Uncharacterized protein n=1 Tax=Trifolium pratense TaxID=57577 RepID=A0ACB0J6I0_TRIPR|nr:unnamed protein product [Trifolium pratense]
MDAIQAQVVSPLDHDEMEFEEYVMEDKWEEVIEMYKNDSRFHKIKLKGRGTALHVAINNGYVNYVERLVDAIVKHDDKSGLTLLNEKDATPLHLAAYRGFTSMCEYIIGKNGERNDFIQVRNSNGETPLFWAVLARQRKVFVYLHQFVQYDFNFAINYDGTTILHVAIMREMFDLANIILYCYPGLSYMKDKNDVTPLEVLATRTSAFNSGSTLLWWEKLLYYCIPVKVQDPKTKMESYNKGTKKEKNESGISIPLYNVHELEKAGKVRYALARLDFIRCAKILCHPIQKFAFRLPIISLFDLAAIKIIKNKHKYGGQPLKAFMKNPCQSYTGGEDPGVDEAAENFAKFIQKKRIDTLRDLQNTTKQETEENKKGEDSAIKDEKDTTFLAVAKSGIVEIMEELDSKVPINSDKKGLLLVAMKNIKKEILSTEKTDKNETAFLIAAKHGIVEMIRELHNQMKSVIHETNSNNENVLLLAVKNRQSHVVELLKRLLSTDIFHGLNVEVDNNGNTMLHLAACASIHNENTWRISGAAMQMMWDIKWYKYIKGLVPDHFSHRTNKEGKFPSEIFKEQHKELLHDSIDWLKDTAESCSVVAALIAGVSFATSGNVPGGNDSDTGKPALEEQPVFEGFAVSSLIGLYFSVTALIMFLSILTSRKRVEDFSGDLPKKLLLGLSSLFVSIVAMLVSFCAGHFFVLTDKYCKNNILFYLYISICLPVTFYAVVQFPLYVDLLKVIWKKVPPSSFKGVHL